MGRFGPPSLRVSPASPRWRAGPGNSASSAQDRQSPSVRRTMCRLHRRRTGWGCRPGRGRNRTPGYPLPGPPSKSRPRCRSGWRSRQSRRPGVWPRQRPYSRAAPGSVQTNRIECPLNSPSPHRQRTGVSGYRMPCRSHFPRPRQRRLSLRSLPEQLRGSSPRKVREAPLRCSSRLFPRHRGSSSENRCSGSRTAKRAPLRGSPQNIPPFPAVRST